MTAYFREGGARCFVGELVWDAVMKTGAVACFVDSRAASSYFERGLEAVYRNMIASGENTKDGAINR